MPVIKCGTSRTVREIGESWRYPQGWQALVRRSGERVLVVVHTFAGSPAEISIPLDGDWKISGSFADTPARMVDDQLMVTPGGDFSGAVFLLIPR